MHTNDHGPLTGLIFGIAIFTAVMGLITHAAPIAFAVAVAVLILANGVFDYYINRRNARRIWAAEEAERLRQMDLQAQAIAYHMSEEADRYRRETEMRSARSVDPRVTRGQQ